MTCFRPPATKTRIILWTNIYTQQQIYINIYTNRYKIYIYDNTPKRHTNPVYSCLLDNNTIFSAHFVPFSPRVRFVRWKIFGPQTWRISVLAVLGESTSCWLHGVYHPWTFPMAWLNPMCDPKIQPLNSDKWHLFVFFWCPALPHSHHLYHWVL